ncbi:fibronectin type 3 domain-containing protein [Mucilaginibacter pineti]|uniref:Fibronectin type 3 domain-containing protein n=1 Tax=Mucilaginibacter pineti TaxID=1391627 RepID=A0A1G6SPZ7_9SPHI|nr:hypothetical protein [Mucilaginibacter pineti]SDD18919.1 fibronectin type 3 domain-containing protein [Mucilaginibacter pineti]
MKNIIIIAFALFTASAFAQQKVVKVDSAALSAKYSGGNILLAYRPQVIAKLDSVSITIYRKGADGDVLLKSKKKIATSKIWHYLDTTTQKAPGVYQYRLLTRADTTLLRTDDVWTYAYAPDTRAVATLFKAVNTKGTNNINLTWTIKYGYSARNIVLERSRKKADGYTAIAVLSNSENSYTDKVHDANEPFFYRLAMSSISDGRVFYSASIFVIPQFPIIPLPVYNVSAQQKDKSIMLSWSNIDTKARGFYIKKRTNNTGDFVNATTLITKNETNKYEWKDSTSTLLSNQTYQYTIVAESNSFDLSKASDTVSVTYINNPVKIPAPQDLRIITANDTVYNLAWSVDSARLKEVAGYAVYLKKANENIFKQLPGFIISNTNYMVIAKPHDGDTYKVKALNGDKRSDLSLPYTYNNAFEKAFGPQNLKAGIINNKLTIKWLISETSTIKEYHLYKYNGKNFVLTDTISTGKDMIATQNYTPGQLNIYQLKAINTDNIESGGSNILQVN